MRFNEDSYIQKLMVLGSSVCNLECSYCYLHDQHKNNAYVLLNKEIQKAWLNGEYVNNIKKVFKELGSNPNIVTDLEFWGGEPIIVANNLINPFKELLTYFPNICFINIPTNFTRVNNVVDFIFAGEEIKQKNNWDVKKHGKLQIHIQLSIDGPPGPFQENGHNISWDIYRKNIETLCREIASRGKLEKTEVDFELHATVELALMNEYLKTTDQIQAYIDYFHDFHVYCNEIIKKYNLNHQVVQAAETMFPHNAQPTETSIQDSLQLKNTLYLLDYLQKHQNYDYNRGTHLYTENGFATGHRGLLGTNPVCIESGVMAVTIMYDGSICECPCDYILNFDKFWDWVKDNPLKQDFYRESLLKKQFYINPLTASQEEKDYFDWYIYDSIRLNTSTSLHMSMNWALELAKSGQIDYTYYNNPEKLLKDLTQFNQEYSCPRDQLSTTKCCYMSNQHVLRRYFNGLAEFVQKDFKEDINFEAKGLYKWNYMTTTEK